MLRSVHSGYDRAMSEQRWKPSVTVAAIIEQQGRYLLVEEETVDGLRLNNPAGHLEPGETPRQGVVREALEETARPFEPEALLGIYMATVERENPDDSVTYVRFAYRGQVGDVIPGRSLDQGIVRTVWMTLDEVRASADRHRSPLVLQCIEDHRAGLRHPLEVVRAG
jgi:ADP-ribose pyrophosphatase YjhB (NUDIX family)